MSLNEKMTGLANKLREKTGVSNNQFKYIPLSGWGQISSAV